MPEMKDAVDLDSTKLLIATLFFGVLGLAATTVVQLNAKEAVSVYFVKLLGLLFVATLAAAIVFADLTSEARTGAYTILGTIAGYLAGSKVSEDKAKKPKRNGDGDGDD